MSTKLNNVPYIHDQIYTWYIHIGLLTYMRDFYILMLQGLREVGRRWFNLLPVAQRIKTCANGVSGSTWVVGREFESHHHHEKRLLKKVNFLMLRI